MYNLNVPIKAKDPPWFAVQMGSVADSVAAKIRIIIDNAIFLERKIVNTLSMFLDKSHSVSGHFYIKYVQGFIGE